MKKIRKIHIVKRMTRKILTNFWRKAGSYKTRGTATEGGGRHGRQGPKSGKITIFKQKF